MNKLIVLLLVMTLSTILVLKTDGKFIQATLATITAIGKIEQFFQKKTDGSNIAPSKENPKKSDK